MGMKKLVPDHLSLEAKKLYKDLIREYGIEDTAGLKILRVSCEAFDRAQSARREIDKDGMAVHDRWGQTKVHPLLAIERDSRAAFLSGIKALNLDLEPLRDKPGRPGGR
jgi:P27 family predicted phage terminase small subunit